MSESIGFLGTGRIAEPMIRSLARRFPSCHIFVSERSRHIAENVATLENVFIHSNQGVLDNSDTVFICLLARIARDVLPNLSFSTRHNVISVMADITNSEISKLIDPAAWPCVTIPLPFIEQGGCPLPVYPKSEKLEGLFGDENDVITLPSEEAMAPHFAATAILSTTMKQLDVVARWLGDQSEDRQNAERYVTNLVSGYLSALPKDGQDRLKEAMEDLSTEGGLNNQLRKHVTESGYYDTLNDGLDALLVRLRRNGD